MQRQICVFFLFCVAATPVDGLKLLSNHDVIEDDDDTWESDIGFSYKPFVGECDKNANGKGGEPAKTPAGNTNINNEAAYTGYRVSAGRYTMLVCRAEDSRGGVVTEADVQKYCKDIEVAPYTWDGAGLALEDIKAGRVVKPQLKPTQTATFLHYAAKLATISNAALKANNRFSFPILAFTVDTSTWSVTNYKEAAFNGKDPPTANKYCYTAAGIAWAKNDPIVKNMDGEEFEIMATGVFSLLTLKAPNSGTMFEASATIDRAGTRCGATYIQNMTFSGQWVKDIGVPRLQIKAEAAVPKAKALQVNFDGEWQHTTSRLSYAAVRHANAYKLNLKLHDLDVTVSLDSHRIHEEGTQTSRFANFLNVNFEGVSGLSGLSIGGLLGRDSHQDATELPKGCDSTQLMLKDGTPKFFSKLEVS